MKNSQAIRAILEDPKFEAIEGHILEMRKDYLETASKREKTVEETGMNTIRYGAMADACVEILESLAQTAGKDIEDRLESLGIKK